MPYNWCPFTGMYILYNRGEGVKGLCSTLNWLFIIKILSRSMYEKKTIFLFTLCREGGGQNRLYKIYNTVNGHQLYGSRLCLDKNWHKPLHSSFTEKIFSVSHFFHNHIYMIYRNMYILIKCWFVSVKQILLSHIRNLHTWTAIFKNKKNIAMIMRIFMIDVTFIKIINKITIQNKKYRKYRKKEVTVKKNPMISKLVLIK